MIVIGIRMGDSQVAATEPGFNHGAAKRGGLPTLHGAISEILTACRAESIYQSSTFARSAAVHRFMDISDPGRCISPYGDGRPTSRIVADKKPFPKVELVPPRPIP